MPLARVPVVCYVALLLCLEVPVEPLTVADSTTAAAQRQPNPAIRPGPVSQSSDRVERTRLRRALRRLASRRLSLASAVGRVRLRRLGLTEARRTRS